MEVWRFEKRDWVVVVIPWGTMGGQCSVCSFLGHPLVEQRYIRNTGRATGFFCAWRRLAGGGRHAWARGSAWQDRRGSGGDLENGTIGHGGKLFLRNDT